MRFFVKNESVNYHSFIHKQFHVITVLQIFTCTLTLKHNFVRPFLSELKCQQSTKLMLPLMVLTVRNFRLHWLKAVYETRTLNGNLFLPTNPRLVQTAVYSQTGILRKRTKPIMAALRGTPTVYNGV